jgi:putative FmdB family regulatory protein
VPLYEYRCEKCGDEYEKREGFDAPARQKCPTCRGAAHRVFHAPPIVFKGSGFYVTDNRSSQPQSSPDTKSKTESSTSSDDSSTAKPSSKGDDSSSKDAEPAAAG